MIRGWDRSNSRPSCDRRPHAYPASRVVSDLRPSSQRRRQNMRLLGLAGMLLVVLLAFMAWVNHPGTAADRLCRGDISAMPDPAAVVVLKFCLP